MYEGLEAAMTDNDGSSVPAEQDAPTPSHGIRQQPADVQPRPPDQPPAPPPGQWTPAPAYQAPPDPRLSPQGLGRPGVIALRPLNLGDIFDGAITAIRRYPRLILGVSAVVAVIGAALNLVSSLLILPDLQRFTALGPAATQQEIADRALDLLGNLAVTVGIALVITLLIRVLLSGFLTVVMGKAVLGRPVTFRDALAEVRPRLLPLLGLTLLYVLVVFAGALLCFVPGIWLGVMFSLATSAMVLERATVRQAMSRSWKLVSGSFWRVFGILLLAALIGGVINLVVGVPFSLGGAGLTALNSLGTAVTPSTGALILQAVGSVLGQTITAPFVAMVTVLVYIDQRMRKEGMDVELARAAGVTPPRSW
jgi:hypothetical protein